MVVSYSLNGPYRSKHNFHFKCKHHYRSCVLRQILDKTMDGQFSLSLFCVWVNFMFFVHVMNMYKNVVSFEIATLAQSTLSGNYVIKHYGYQTAPIQSMHVFLYTCSCCVVLCNSDSCKGLIAWCVSINVNGSTVVFWVLYQGFPSF